eukprot:140857-Hanusia_phi.AAC.1
MQQTEKYLKYSHLRVADGLWNEDLWFHCSSLYYRISARANFKPKTSAPWSSATRQAAVCRKAAVCGKAYVDRSN